MCLKRGNRLIPPYLMTITHINILMGEYRLLDIMINIIQKKTPLLFLKEVRLVDMSIS